ncbi:arginyltransferase [Lacimicrobium alkaliphilum]|uniref:Aspartate/glutamate leucyltransferase n=1 Tax=Lacimicrobium alkaliphilum TaxID=1526571 RepID=A0ABQ1R0C9_9ALTE|nr:arginyltransferase [Lacimicrobium alkaliphilum]GGD53658.1 putative arginyl-tRNA--protein transferase [Lacimicrobium alkaliphilum]
MRFGLTEAFPCSYLPEQQEQVLLHLNDEPVSNEVYAKLLQNGFRRSADSIYRPYCPACNACQSLRIDVEHFRPTRNQRKVINRNKDLDFSLSTQDKEQYYALYERYINTRHANGSMYPPSPEQYRHFISSLWAETQFMEIRLNQQLIGVAITDSIDDGLSAFYTFFEPELEKRSLGTLAILKQIELTRQQCKRYLYLGYQIDDCSKMNYKARFGPHQRFIDNKWQ